MRIKTLIFLTLVCSFSNAQQNDTAKAKEPSLFSKLEAYAFCDLVKLAGVGMTYNSYGAFSCDLRVAYLYPNKLMEQFVHANDYFYSQGVSLAIMPKFFERSGGVYFGIYNALNFYGYKNKVADIGADYHYSDVKGELRDKQTLGFTILSPTIGRIYKLKKINLEWFISVGRERTHNKFTVYSRAAFYGHPLKSYPEIYTEDVKQFNLVLGIKVGFGLKPRIKTSFAQYEEGLKQKLKKAETTIDEMMSSGKISATDYWDEYIPFKEARLKKLKKEFKRKRSDIKHMEDFT